jgi:hypothetical protein
MLLLPFPFPFLGTLIAIASSFFFFFVLSIRRRCRRISEIPRWGRKNIPHLCSFEAAAAADIG